MVIVNNPKHLGYKIKHNYMKMFYLCTCCKDQILYMLLQTVPGLNVTEDCRKQKLHASSLSADEAGVRRQRHKRDPRHQSLSCTSTGRLHGISPEERRRYLAEDEIDQAGRRQPACLSAWRGLDMADIKGEERGSWVGGWGHRRKSDLKSPKGGLLV